MVKESGKRRSGKRSGWIAPPGKQVRRIQLKLDAATYFALIFLLRQPVEGKPGGGTVNFWFRDGLLERAKFFGFDAEASARAFVQSGVLPDFVKEELDAEQEEDDRKGGQSDITSDWIGAGTVFVAAVQTPKVAALL